MRSNCLLFACALYWMRCRGHVRKKKLDNAKRNGINLKPPIKREGYLAIRRSRWGAFPHVLYAERRSNGNLRIVSYIPIAPKHKPIPPAVFKGQSKWGDL